MKYQFHFLILLQIVFFNTVKAQSEIYKYHRRNDKLEQIGKCDSNVILIIGKKKSTDQINPAVIWYRWNVALD